VRPADLQRAAGVAAGLVDHGFRVSACGETAVSLRHAGVPLLGDACLAEDLHRVLRAISRRDITLVVITSDARPASATQARAIRVAAQAAGVTVVTTLAGAEALVQALAHADAPAVRRLQDLHPARPAPASAAGGIPPGSFAAAERLNVFVRQPYTEVGVQEQGTVADVLNLLEEFNGPSQAFNYLAGSQAQSAGTFRDSFELESGVAFTPGNFRRYRMQLLDRADLFVNIRVCMSESSAFELAYHIFKGRCTPVLYLVWKRAPIKTTLLRDLQSLCDVTYLEFERVEELRPALRAFFQSRMAPHRSIPVQKEPCEASHFHS
jgi:carbamoyl-phosphate synthase large subunit